MRASRAALPASSLLGYARPGDSLVVVRLDRLGRSLRELIDSVAALKGRHINLVSPGERMDTSSATGELVFHVFGAIARFGRRLISGRTRNGLRAARGQGRTPGRSRGERQGSTGTPRPRDMRHIRHPEAARYVGIGRSTACWVLRESNM